MSVSAFTHPLLVFSAQGPSVPPGSRWGWGGGPAQAKAVTLDEERPPEPPNQVYCLLQHWAFFFFF